MNNALMITKIMIRNLLSSFSYHEKKSKRAKKSQKSTIAIIITLIVALLLIGFSFFFTAYFILDIAVKGLFVRELITIIAPIILVFTILLSLTLVLSTFFFASDNTTYLSLPIRTWELFLGRLVCCLLSIYILQAIFVLPMFIAFDIVLTPHLIIYINQILIFIALPWIPISLIFVFFLFISKIINIHKYREFLSFFLLGIILVLYLVLQISSVTLLPDENITAPDDLVRYKEIYVALAEKFSFMNFYTIFVRESLLDSSYSGFLHALSFFGLSGLMVIFISFVANKLYLKSIIGSDESISSKRKKTHSLRLSKSTSVFKEYLKKEWRTLYRSPNYFLQLIFPLFLIFLISLVSIISAMAVSPMNQEIEKDFIATLIPYLNSDRGGLPIIITGLSLIFSSISLSSGCAISRDGSNAYLLKILPVSPLLQLRSKILLGVIFGSIFTIIMIAFIGILLKTNIIVPILSFIPAFLGIVFTNYLMILIDLRFPYLDWSSELAAVKQNKSTLLSMLVCFVVGFMATGLGVALAFVKISAYITLPVISIVFALGIFGVEHYIRKYEQMIFSNIS